MRSPRLLLGLALACSAFLTAATQAQTIVLYSDAGCASSALAVETGSMATFYVAYTGLAGLVSAEFRIEGLPADWPVIAVTPHPAATVVIGDPFDDGALIGFPEARSETVCLNLFTIQIQAASKVSDHVLTVASHRNPSNPTMQCPSAAGSCGGPCTWRICVVGGQLFVNSTVPASPATLSQVKSLYE